MTLVRALLPLGVLVLLWSPAAAAEHPALARARTLYNAHDYPAAITAAAVSRRHEASADASALVIARSHLELYRQRADPTDLAAAREALATVRSAMLPPRDQLDLLVGLAQSLYLSEAFGAAAELFDTALSRAASLEDEHRSMLLDWWATALDREAQTRNAEDRRRPFERIAARMEDEIRRDPGSPVANYWFAVAARGAGEIERAWDAAVAAWVRSTLRPESAVPLRADLDRLVTQALIPERVRRRAAREQPSALAMFTAEWDLVKQQWK